MHSYLRSFAAAVTLLILGSVPTISAPPENADPRLAPLFNSLRQPGTGVSCCSVSDCRPVDYRVSGAGYEVWIDDSWRQVPADKILQGRDNPIGRAVVCYTPALGIMCFVRGTET